MAQLNDLLVMGQSTLLGPLSVTNHFLFDTSKSSTGTTQGDITSLIIYGTTYGNKVNGANSPYTKTQGRLSYGDPGPQIVFGSSSAFADRQKAALIFTDHNDIASGCSLSLVSTETEGVYFITDNLKIYNNIELASSSGKITRAGASSLWWSGRDYALLKMTSINGYSACISTKSPNGSWEMGTYASDGDDLIFTYVSDTCYDSKSNGGGDGYKNAVRITKNGQLQATSFNATSDARLKENFQYFMPQKSILDLPIYKFDFITGAKNQIGCKAQDLREICPEIVTENSDGYLSIQESKIVYLLIDEVKKLKEEIQVLRGNKLLWQEK